MSLRSTLHLASQRALAPFGLRLVRTTPNRVRGIDPMADMEFLLGHTRAPVIFDVGANDGEMTAEFLKHFPDATMVAFEPFESCYQGLQKKFSKTINVRLERLALGAERGTKTFHLYSGSNMNSLLTLDRQDGNVLRSTFAAAGETQVTVETLDHFCREQKFDRVDILKVDTQGFDLQVLHGAEGCLKAQRVRTILIEVNFIPIYQNQARFREIHEFLVSCGYRLVDFYNQNRHQGYTAWCDACYVAVGAA